MSKLKLKVNVGKLSYILIAVCVALTAIDLVLKYCEEAFSWNFTVIPGFIWVESGNRNPGAAFSFLANAEWGQTFLIVFTFIMLIFLICGFIVLPERFPLLKLAVSMVVAGAIGNLVDRLMFREVRDFVWMNMGFSTACCNFADFWIVLAVVIAIIDLLFLNEWAVFPLTKRAKEAQAKRESNEKLTGEGITAKDVTDDNLSANDAAAKEKTDNDLSVNDKQKKKAPDKDVTDNSASDSKKDGAE